MTRRLLSCLCTAALLALAGCGGSDADEPRSAGQQNGAKTEAAESTGPARKSAEIDISDFAYGPEQVTVARGAKVTFVNEDEARHDAKAAGSLKFQTADLDRGDSDSVRLRKAGSYSYICSFHPFMKGTVRVR